MVPPSHSVDASYVILRRKDLIEPPTLDAVRQLVREAVPHLDAQEQDALCRSVLLGRVVIARRSVDVRSDTPDVVDLAALAAGGSR